MGPKISKIFIYGVPGAGKTTVSLELQSKLQYPLVEADALREIAQKEKTEREDPFVYVGTTEAFRKFGELSEDHAIKGLQAVRKSMAPYVSRKIFEYPDRLILEGAFLDPEKICEFGKLVLIITSDEQKHSSHYFEHREQNENNTKAFQAARIIQGYIFREASMYDVSIIENGKAPDDLVMKM